MSNQENEGFQPGHLFPRIPFHRHLEFKTWGRRIIPLSTLALVALSWPLVPLMLAFGLLGLVLVWWTDKGFVYQRLIINIRSRHGLRRRKGQLYNRPLLIPEDYAADPFGVTQAVVGVTGTLGGTVPVFAPDDRVDDVFYIALTSQHGIIYTDAASRAAYNTWLMQMAAHLSRLHAKTVTSIQMQLPPDALGNLARLQGSIGTVKEEQAYRNVLRGNLARAHDIAYSEDQMMVQLLALQVPRIEAWGSRRRPEEIDSLSDYPIANILGAVSHHARRAGLVDERLSTLEATMMMRIALDPTCAEQMCRLFTLDQERIRRARGTSQPFSIFDGQLMQLGPWPDSDIAGGDDWVKIGGAYHRTFQLVTLPGSSRRASPRFFDAMLNLSSNDGWVSHSLTTWAVPRKHDEREAKLTHQYWRSRNRSDRRVKPSELIAQREAQADYIEQETASGDNFAAVRLVRLTTRSREKLDRISRAIVESADYEDLTLDVVRRLGRQAPAVLLSLGMNVYPDQG